jgi:SET domain-containing protein
MTDWEQVPRVYAADSPIHGRGLYAAESIAEGAYIGCYDGQRTEENGMHVLWVEGDLPGEWIGYDGTNVLRFLNHSKHPNAELDGQELYAISDVQPGEEITIDYGEWFDDDE